MMKISHEDIKLYPMTQDVSGMRTHKEYVETMARMVGDIMCGYRLDPETLHQLAIYYTQNKLY
jgi:chromosome condensin MukBEF MukE localization factor